MQYRNTNSVTSILDHLQWGLPGPDVSSTGLLHVRDLNFKVDGMYVFIFFVSGLPLTKKIN